MPIPDFRVIESASGPAVTYTCGCMCTPSASLAAEGAPGSEHCCCGKVHFAGAGAVAALEIYLAARKVTRKREPEYDLGSSTFEHEGAEIEVAWAFPRE